MWEVIIIEHDAESTVTSRLKVDGGYLYRVMKAGNIALVFVPDGITISGEVVSDAIGSLS
jgi:hypothetical protein